MLRILNYTDNNRDWINTIINDDQKCTYTEIITWESCSLCQKFAWMHITRISKSPTNIYKKNITQIFYIRSWLYIYLYIHVCIEEVYHTQETLYTRVCMYKCVCVNVFGIT